MADFDSLLIIYYIIKINFSLCTALHSNITIRGKIVGSIENTGLVMKFVAVLLDSFHRQYCSGVVVSKHHILSAAFCIKPFKELPEFGFISIRIAAQLVFVNKMEYPKKYSAELLVGSTFDIGVITVCCLTSFTHHCYVLILYRKIESKFVFRNLKKKTINS